MSVQALSSAFAVRGLSPSEKLVLLALANFANERLQCWPSQDRLADDTELGTRTVWGALKSLEAKGLLTRISRKREDGTRSTDVFTLSFEAAQPVADIAKPNRKSCESQSPDLRKPVAAVATPTTFEPSVSKNRHKNEPLLVARSAPTEKRRVRLVPENWGPSVKVMADLAGQGFVPGEIERELASFRDHEFRDPKSDFDRAFRTWMRNSRKFNTGPRHERPHHDAKFTARQANLARAFAGADAASGQRWDP